MKIPPKLIFTSLLAILFVVGTSVSLSRYFEHYTSEFIDHDIYSEFLSEERRVFVRLPKGYDSQKSYPLIIKSDGNFNLSRWHETVTTQSEKKLIEDSVIVSIPNLFWTDTRNRDLVPPYARKDVQIEARPSTENSPEIFGKADLFLSFIEKELIPFIENKYSINDNRVLSGFSAGGSFVLYTIVTKPELFTGYFAFSPAAWYDNSVVVQEFNNGLSKLSEKPLFLYLSIGGNENEIITGSFKGLLSAIELNAPINFNHAFHYNENSGHSDNPYYSVPKALLAYYEFRKNKI
ncbi:MULTISPECIES: alpha/beta hydrolase [unclassified Pseudoalteromonas]|uniref:alpha/beta hydrolase n=1 Tax=unclassified Pseudoalteromonas TaxID=194690 RepID=UPI00301438F2